MESSTTIYPPFMWVKYPHIIALTLKRGSTQWKNELDLFLKIHTSVQRGYVDKKPKWLSCPDESMICVFTQNEMASKTAAEIQQILRYRHICIIGPEETGLSFDEKGLESLADLDKPIIMHGESN